MNSIQDGEFFNIFNKNYTISDLQNKYDFNQINKFNVLFQNMQKEYLLNDINIPELMELDISIYDKKQILEKIYLIANTEILSNQYNRHVNDLKELLYFNKKKDLMKLEQDINNDIKEGNLSNSYKIKILQSNMPYHNKVMAYKHMEIMESYNSNSSSEEYNKYKTWLDTLLKIPFDKYYTMTVDNTLEYMKNIRSILDEELSFMENAKDHIINIISHLIRNPTSNVNALGLYGNKGLGKTQFVETIAKALKRPLIRISLGGNSDVTTLKGHNFTYIGSQPGKIIDAIINSNIMNPIIFFDEIDKVSNSNKGSEIIGFLIHLIDLTTNKKYNGDEYFSGIEFNLSRALFIFSYNNPDLLDPILADRIYKIKINNYTVNEKIEITKTHLINKILKDFLFTNSQIQFENDAIKYIIELSKNEDGLRLIKSNIHTIISRINTLLIINSSSSIINLQYKKLDKYYNKLPLTIQKNHIDILLENSLPKSNYNNSYLNLYT